MSIIDDPVGEDFSGGDGEWAVWLLIPIAVAFSAVMTWKAFDIAIKHAESTEATQGTEDEQPRAEAPK